MTKTTLPCLALAAFSAFALAACSGATTTTTAAEVTLDPAVAKTMASALTTAVTSAQRDDGVGIAAAFGSAANQAAGLIAAARDASQSVIDGSAASSTCSCPSATKTCTFTSCAIGRAVVTGSVSWAGSAITCNKLTFAVPETSTALGAVNVLVDCKLTYGPGSVAGSLTMKGDAEVQQVTYTWDAGIRPNDVTFSGSAFTGGSIDLDANVTAVSAKRGTESYAGTAVVSLP